MGLTGQTRHACKGGLPLCLCPCLRQERDARRAQAEAEQSERELEELQRQAEAKKKEDEGLQREVAKKNEEERLQREAEEKKKEEERLQREVEEKKKQEERLQREAEAKKKEEERLQREAEAKKKEEEKLQSEVDDKNNEAGAADVVAGGDGEALKFAREVGLSHQHLMHEKWQGRRPTSTTSTEMEDSQAERLQSVLGVSKAKAATLLRLLALQEESVDNEEGSEGMAELHAQIEEMEARRQEANARKMGAQRKVAELKKKADEVSQRWSPLLFTTHECLLCM